MVNLSFNSRFANKIAKISGIFIFAIIYSISFYKTDSFITASLALGFLYFIFSKKSYSPGIGFLSGCLAFMALSYFIPEVLNDKFSFSFPTAFIIHFIFAGILPGIFFEAFVLIQYLVHKKTDSFFLRTFFTAFLITLLEAVRTSVSVTGIWGHPSLLFTDMNLSPFICSFAGINALSFIFFLISSIIAESFLQLSEKNFKKGSLYIFLALLISSTLFLDFKFHQKKGETETIRFTIIHPGIPHSRRWKNENRLIHLYKYISLSEKALGKNRDTILVWPETAIWWDPRYDNQTNKILKNFAEKNNTSLIFGAPSINFNNNSRENKNSVFTINSNQKIEKVYDKIRLIPFIEKENTAIPFPEKRNLFFYTPGTRQQSKELIFDTDKKFIADFLICYEVNFLKKNRNQNTQIIIQLSNDSWFNKSHVSLIELKMLRLLSMEKGIPSIRASGYGIAAFIDRNGKIITSTEIDGTKIISASITIPKY